MYRSKLFVNAYALPSIACERNFKYVKLSMSMQLNTYICPIINKKIYVWNTF